MGSLTVRSTLSRGLRPAVPEPSRLDLTLGHSHAVSGAISGKRDRLRILGGRSSCFSPVPTLTSWRLLGLVIVIDCWMDVQGIVLDDRIGWRCTEIRPMEQEELLSGVRSDFVAVLGHHRRQPGGFARQLGRVDLRLAPAAVHHDEPGQPGPHHEPDDEQPYVELGVHCGRV
jgi:hypothetical protein